MSNSTTISLTKRAFLLLVVFFLSSHLFAGELTLNNGKSGVVFSNASYQGLNFTVHLSSIHYRDVVTKKGTFTEVSVEDYGFHNQVGDPKLPVFHKLIEVPLNASYEVSYGKMTYQEIDLASQGITNPLMPFQESVSKSSDLSKLPFVVNSSTYSKDEFFGTQLVSIQNQGILRSVNLANLMVAPIYYNPVTKKLRVFTDLEVIVTFKNADIDATMELRRRTASPYFNNIYQVIPNYQSNLDNLITSGPVTFAIVADPNFQTALQPFIEWKIRKGYKVIDAYTNNPAVGTTTASIRSYLMNLYQNPPTGYAPPSFILLVGDVGQIPAFTTGGHPSDLNYCEYTGDHIPEVFYGRFAASNLTQLQAYIDKTLEYEQYTMPNDAYLNEVSMIAGADPTYGPLHGNGQINYGTNTYFNSAHNLLSHTYLQPEPGGANYSQSIRNDVSNGVAYSNYTAHGSEQGWADPQFVISQIGPLQNAHKYCLMVGNCCKTANFTTTCFAKEITRTPGKGALGYIGCSDYSYWDEDYWWGCGYKSVSTNPQYNAQHLGAYDKTFHDHGESIDKWFVTMGQMVVGGNLAVQESNSSLKNYYWEAYCLMGDPSVSIYYSVPPAISASYPQNLAVGTTSFTVTTEPYAYVSASMNDSVLLDAKCADSTGIVNLVFDSINSNVYVQLVITKQNRKPLLDSIQVAAFMVGVQATQNILCQGQSTEMNVTVNGGSGTYTYLWIPGTFLNDSTIANPVSVPANTVDYNVSVNDGFNTVVSSTLHITVRPAPQVPTVTIVGDSLVSDVANGNQWYLYDQPIAGATGQSFTPVVSGDYSTRITNIFTGCFSQSNVIPYYFTGSENLKNQANLNVYPNPVTSEATISFHLTSNTSVKVTLYDAHGALVRTLKNGTLAAGDHLVVFTSEGIDSGLYFVRIESSEFNACKGIVISK